MRQLAKEQDDAIRHQIDSDFGNVRDLLFGLKVDPASSGSNSVPLGVRSSRTGDAADGASPSNDDSSTPGPSTLSLPTAKPAKPATLDDDDDYDRVVRQLVFDKRAKPTDRTKTDEEIAAEEAEKLRKQERARLRRMRGELNESESDSDGRLRKRRRGAPQADDLEDDFDVNEGEDWVLGPGLEHAVLAGPSDEDGDEVSEGDTVSESETDSSSDDAESEDTSSEGSDDASKTNLGISVASKREPRQREPRKKGDLPFTFPAPSSHEEFLEIIEDLDPSDTPTVVQRLRTIYHSSLSEDNKFKLQVCPFSSQHCYTC